ncbi:hypothetical protein B0H11DRAFT_1909110 [Mycena galericulata]|nr:hypothetical protein B0H11DRAFT_1909110 [Mycena galericulata]
MASYANISGLMLFENPRKITKKVTVLDVLVFVGPAEENHLLGSVRYFHNDDDTPVQFENGVYSCQIRVVKREDDFDVHAGTPENYAFVGDLKAFAGPVDASQPYRVYTHILGLVSKSVQEDATFEIDAEQYTLAHADAKKVAEEAAKQAGTPIAPTSRSIFPILGFFGNSQRYKNGKKPLPYIDKVVLVGGFLAGISETLQGTVIKKRFLVEVDEITFISTPTIPQAPKLPSSVTPSSSSGGASGRFSSYYSKKRARTDSGGAAPSSPSPATK